MTSWTDLDCYNFTWILLRSTVANKCFIVKMPMSWNHQEVNFTGKHTFNITVWYLATSTHLLLILPQKISSFQPGLRMLQNTSARAQAEAFTVIQAWFFPGFCALTLPCWTLKEHSTFFSDPGEWVAWKNQPILLQGGWVMLAFGLRCFSWIFFIAWPTLLGTSERENS